MIDRRQLMSAVSAGVLGAVALRALPGISLAAPLPDIDLAAPVVDIHCHVFNSADLPVYGFLKSAVFEVYDDQQQVGTTAQAPCAVAGQQFPLSRFGLKMLAIFLDGVMGNAIAAGEEAGQLASGLVPAGPAGTPLAADLQDFFGPPPEFQPAGPKTRKQKLIEREFTPEQAAAAREELRVQIAKDSGADPAFAPAGSATALTGEASESFTGRHINWAKRMASSRFKHAQEISKIYSPKVRLFTPALVDYSKWLDDEPASNLKTQVDAMEQISLRAARAGGARFHGYIAFDPLRDVHENGAALRLVQTAVAQRGFIGAKLYPPMGFKPLANASDPSMTFPKHALTLPGGATLTASGLAFALDRRLADLYAWCEREGVPILAHAADSRGAGPCYSARANTSNWLPVVARFKNLRVCLAHLGSFDVARDSAGRLDIGKLEQSWEWRFGKLISQDAPNVCADLSYFHEVLSGDEAGIAATKAAFVKLLRAFPAMTDRLIYGSDWIMLDREAKREEHLKAVYWFMAGVLKQITPEDAKVKAMLANIFSKNAIRFLGLEPSGKTAGRLIAFYGRHAMPNADRMLDEFRIT